MIRISIHDVEFPVNSFAVQNLLTDSVNIDFCP